mmetsp:Transcript_139390/g.347556  ORF Transcript_139390/g.347556 Transcript_139390/m.347556 type:complete len:90 (-) Transcript_139390:39-308(-)
MTNDASSRDPASGSGVGGDLPEADVFAAPPMTAKDEPDAIGVMAAAAAKAKAKEKQEEEGKGDHEAEASAEASAAAEGGAGRRSERRLS